MAALSATTPDLNQCSEHLKSSAESLKYIKELTVRSMKVCQRVLNELEFTFGGQDLLVAGMKASFEEIVNTCVNAVGMLSADVFDPVQKFLIDYSLKAEEIKVKGRKILNEAINLHQTTEIDKNAYYGIKERHYRADNMLKKFNASAKPQIDVESSTPLNSQVEKLAELAKQVKEAHTTYEDSVIRANSILAQFANQYRGMASQVKELEDKKAELVKSSLTQYANLLKSFSAVCLAEAEKFLKQADGVVALEMEQISTNRSNEKFAAHLLEPIKYLDKKMGGAQSEEGGTELSKASAGILCKKLFSGEGGLSPDERSKLVQSLKRGEVHEIVVASLASVASPVFFKSEAAFVDASRLCEELVKLDNYAEDTVSLVFNAGKQICLKKENFKQMYMEMGEVWKDPHKWKEFLDGVIEAKTKHLRSDTSDDSRKKQATIAASTLSTYTYFFGNTCHRHNDIVALIDDCADRCGIGADKVAELLVEVTTSQPAGDCKARRLGEADALRERSLAKCGGTPVSLVIAKSIPYMGDLKTLRSILVLSKALNNKLKYYVYFTLFTSSPISVPCRMKIWEQLLSFPSSSPFAALKEEYAAAVDTRMDSDLIKLDVKRSFQTTTAFSPDSLTRVLECWATREKDIGYYQGMNFVASLFLLLTNDEAAAFAYFDRAVKFSQVYKLFTPDMTLLLIRCYQLNRLIFTYYPALGSWLQSEAVLSSCFATSWFITAFSNSLHGTKDEPLPPLLLAVWDAFLTDGWKAVFKTALFIIGKAKERLEGKRMNELVKIFPEFQQSIFKSGEETAAEFIREYKKIKVTNRMLESLQKEYEKIMRLNKL